MGENTTSPYRRIEANIFYTRLLLVALAVLLTPVFLFLSQYLAAWIDMAIGGSGGWRTYIKLQVLSASILLLGALIRVNFVSNALPSSVGAVAALEGTAYEIKQRVENLCLAVGLSPPQLNIVPEQHRNAFATGTDPSNTTIVLTQGLADILSPSEVDSVIALELAHILNRDTLLNSTVAGIVRTFRLPLLVYILFWGMAEEGLRSVSLSDAWDMYLQNFNYVAVAGSDEPPRWLRIFLFSIAWWGLPIVLAWPLLAGLIQSRISRRRQYLADAEAVTITRNPDSLKRALKKLYDQDRSSVAIDAPRSLFGLEHLCIVPPFHGIKSRIFPTHPSLEARIHSLDKMGPGEPTSRDEISTAMMSDLPELTTAAESRRGWFIVAAALGLVTVSVGAVLIFTSSRQEARTAVEKSGNSPTKQGESERKHAPVPASEVKSPTAEPVSPTPIPRAAAPSLPLVAGPTSPTPAPAAKASTSSPSADPASPSRTPSTVAPTMPPADEPAAPTTTPAIKTGPPPSLATELKAPASTTVAEAPSMPSKPAAQSAKPFPRKGARQKRGASTIEISPQ